MTTRFGSPPPKGGDDSERARRLKRRFQSRSDEEIERNIDRRHWFRQGWPKLPPIPVTEITTGAQAAIGNKEALRADLFEQVQTIFKLNRVETQFIYFAYRRPRVIQPDSPYLSLVITASLRDRPDLDPAIIETVKLLQQHKETAFVAVEVLQYGTEYGLYEFNISPNEHWIVNNFENMINRTLKVIQTHQEKWMTLHISRLGCVNSPSGCPPHVVVTTPTAENDVWTERIVPDIQKELKGSAVQMQVIVLCDERITTANPDTFDNHHINHFGREVMMGASIGEPGTLTAGSSSEDGGRELECHPSATAGGVVRLGDGQLYALTNSHLMFKNENLKKRWEYMCASAGGRRPALAPGTFDPKTVTINCPSDEIQAKFVGKLESMRQEPRTITNLATVTNMNRRFGHLYAASAFRTVRCEKFPSAKGTGEALQENETRAKVNYVLDWALVKLDNTRRMSNRLPAHPDIPSFIKLDSGRQYNNWTTLNQDKHKLNAVDIEVVKFGMTSAYTKGLVDCLPIIINPGVESGAYANLAEPYGLTVENCGRAFAVRHPPSDEYLRFQRGGDSGSIALLADSGVWVGLMFGSTALGGGIMIPIDVILHDIEAVTGQKVMEPSFRVSE